MKTLESELKCLLCSQPTIYLMQRLRSAVDELRKIDKELRGPDLLGLPALFIVKKLPQRMHFGLQTVGIFCGGGRARQRRVKQGRRAEPMCLVCLPSLLSR
jgi:hypothetical protein